MHFAASENSVRRIASCGLAPEFRVICVTMAYSGQPALKLQAMPTVKPANRSR
jgi:hypothetical protein